MNNICIDQPVFSGIKCMLKPRSKQVPNNDKIMFRHTTIYYYLHVSPMKKKIQLSDR